MLLIGVSAMHHDAALCVAEFQSDTPGKLLFAGHAERYSRRKNDPDLNAAIVADALAFGRPDGIVWYERPWKSRLRMLMNGETAWRRPRLSSYLARHGLGGIPIRTVGHHEAHAAGGFHTSGFDEAAILVLDAVGEFDCETLWIGKKGEPLKRLWKQGYPDSVGLFYSAFTDRIGLKPNEEEYIMMGMAALGEPRYADEIRRDLIGNWQAHGEGAPTFHLRKNLHRGVRWWRPDLGPQHHADIAASVQKVAEDYLVKIASWARRITESPNLVLAGGVALNCVANSRIAQEAGFERIWIMPNPGDAGSSLGALAVIGGPLAWEGPFLGHDAGGDPDINAMVKLLRLGQPVGLCHGRAEFGPRALGHRSLLFDPRRRNAKDRLNAVKGREAFRPFAPAVLAEHATEHFEMPLASISPYMQFVAKVRSPDMFPAITHADGTARVQTVGPNDCKVLRRLLEAFYAETGCPMLVNTSLNVKGEPIVNTRADAVRFEQATGVRVF